MKILRAHERGNTTGIVLAVLAVIAIGALAYMSGKMASDQKIEVAATEGQTNTASSETLAPTGPVIEPGNPVVAKVNGDEILRSDVVAYINTLPLQAKQLPLEQLYPAALSELVNEKVARAKSAKANLDNDPEVKKRLAEIKKELVATAFLQNTVKERMTEEKLKEAYDVYVANFPEVEEVRASHILVEKSKDATKLINQLEEGADFAKLAEENSIDTGSAKNGGDINYFTKADVVPEFAEAAFTMEVGIHSFKPVKTDFGYHIIKVADKRMRAPASYEDSKPFLEGQLRQAILQSVLSGWRNEAKIEVFDINGKPVKAAPIVNTPVEAAE